VGKFFTEALFKTGKHKVTAITRSESTSKFPAGVEVKNVNYDDQSSLVEALQGQEVLIITMGVTAPPGQEAKLIEAAAVANVPWVLPNEYGSDPTNVELAKDLALLSEAKTKSRNLIEKLGQSSWIALICSFWYEFSLAGTAVRYGFDFKNRSVVLFDDGKTRINTTTWPQCGRAIASLLSLKVLPDDENDKSPCLADFRNKFVYISSFNISQRDMLDSVLRVTGTREKDWKIEYQDVKERYKQGVEEFQKGNLWGFGQLLYSRLFFPDGSGNYEATKGLHNDILGLPHEDLDEYTKIAVEMAKESGS